MARGPLEASITLRIQRVNRDKSLVLNGTFDSYDGKGTVDGGFETNSGSGDVNLGRGIEKPGFYRSKESRPVCCRRNGFIEHLKGFVSKLERSRSSTC